MSKFLKSKGRPSPALVISLIALFVALGSGAYAANKIGTNQIKGKAVTTGKLAGKAVTTGKLGAKAVKTGKLAGGAVTELKLGDQSVTSSKLSDESVKSDELGRIITRTEDTTIAPQTSGTVSVSCESDEKVVSGGWEGPPMVPNATIYLVSADQKDSEGWTASTLNFGTAPIQLEVHAYCLESSS